MICSECAVSICINNQFALCRNLQRTNMKQMRWKKKKKREQTKLPVKVQQNDSYTGSTQQEFKQKTLAQRT